MWFRKVIVFVFFFTNSPLKSQNHFELHYLGNMGVAIIHQDSAVIIDGLHDFYGKDYLPTDSSALNAMLQRQNPYKNIIAIAVTHKHNDHFDSTLITAVANSHKDAALIGGKQTKNLLGSPIQKRLMPVADSITLIIKPNLWANLKRIAHINPARHADVENYRIEVVWNGFRVVHFGDAAISPDAIKGLKVSPDFIVVPDWFLGTEAMPFLQELNPVNIIVAHISPLDKGMKNANKLKSKIIPFKVYGDKIKIKV